MARHRAAAPTVAGIVAAVKAQFTGPDEIVAALKALTVGRDEYHKRFEIEGRPVRLENRGRAARMGYHGGGWDIAVGVEMGRRGPAGTILITLGRGSIRIDPAKKG